MVRTEVAMNITDKQLENLLVFGWVTGFKKIYLGSLRRMENALFNGQWILCPALPMVGLFDCESKILKHIAVAGIFFLVLIIYNGLTISIMILNKD